MTPFNGSLFRTMLLLLLLLLLSSCTGPIISGLIGPTLNKMGQQSDIELVCEGTSAYLLMIDSLIAENPDDQTLLALGAKSYGGVIGAMQECNTADERITAFADKAYLYGTALLSRYLPVMPADSLSDLEKNLARISQANASEVFWGTFAWIVWVQQQHGRPASLAGLGKIEKILLRIIEVDESVQQGAAHFLLGGYYGSRPSMFGGNPEKSRYHFDKALQLSERKMLIYQTTYAETLARLTMDKELHDALLGEVAGFSLASSPENTLSNQIAKRKAQRLLQEKFFADQ